MALPGQARGAPADGAAARSPGVLLTGVLLGIGVVGAIDEAVFHQLLQWHTLYWGTDEHGRLVSDGLFHLLSAAILVWAVIRVAQTPQARLRSKRAALLAAALIGAGGFNLYDGLVQHLLLHLHLVDEFICADPQANNSIATCPADVPFEAAWLLVAAVLLAAGAIGWRRAASPGPQVAVAASERAPGYGGEHDDRR